jgi:KaiC/GvpD/RAD55 family RecA-like ATPase
LQEFNIPGEIAEFFHEDTGQLLLIKGESGTGKTTFALEVLKKLCGKNLGAHVFVRLEKQEINQNFPKINKPEFKDKILIFDKSHNVADANKFEKEFKIQVSKNKFSIMVIDTIDGMVERYENPNRILKELIEIIKETKVNTLLVQEQESDGYVDYLVEGIVTLKKSEMDGRRVRYITLDKLRGVEIKQPRYLVTLQNGQFRSFKPFDPNYPTRKSFPNELKVIKNQNQTYSTGISDLDNLLAGGFKKGSYNVIEVDDNVSSQEYLAIIRSIILNFLAQDLGVISVLSGGNHPEAIRNDFTRFIDKKQFDKFMRITDYFNSESKNNYIMALGVNREEALKILSSTIRHLRGKTNKPILNFTGLDTLEYLRGEAIAIKELLTGVGTIKVSNDVGLGLIKPGLKLTQSIKNMADTYLKIIDIDRCCCIFGEKPQTPIYAVTPDDSKNILGIELTPLV